MYNRITLLYSREWHIVNQLYLNLKNSKKKKRKSQIGKFNGKGKHEVEVGNHPYANMTSKPATMRRVEMQEMGNASEIKRPET